MTASPSVDSHDPRTRTRRAARIAMMTAIAVAGGYLLIAVPNVELVTVTVALAGWMLGARSGALVGIFAATIFGALNVFGLPYPPVWIAQMIGQGLTGFLFGRLRGVTRDAPPATRIWLSAALGALLTFVYDALTNIAFPIATGVGPGQWWAYLVAGIPFALTHIVSNAFIFALILPVAWDRIGRRFALPPISPAK